MRGIVLAVAAALAPAVAVAAEQLVPLPLEALRGRIETQAAHSFGPGGLEIAVDGNTNVALGLSSQVLELELEASGPMLLTWAARTPGKPFRPFGPPWRHLTVPRRPTRVTLDMRITDGWAPSASAAIGLTGAGKVLIHAVRVLPVERDPEAGAAAYDRAMLWAPESIGHTTINLLTPSWWSASRGIRLSDVVAGAGAAAFALVLAAFWWPPRRLAPAHALAAAALVAAGLWNVHMLVRFLPVFDLRPTPDVEERIRDNYWIAPDVGALAALARATLRPDERVGAVSLPKGWFAPQTLCFNLFPRRCAIVAGDVAPEQAGISGVDRLRGDELDAVVVYRSPLPPGFVPVASLGPAAVVARRVR